MGRAAAADAMGALFCTMLERIAALEKAWMIIFPFVVMNRILTQL